MSEIWRAKNDTKVYSPSCLMTIGLFVVIFCVFVFCLANYLTENSGKLFMAAYPLMEPMIEKDASQDERQTFSNAYFKIASVIDEDPLILTNKSLLLLKFIVMDQKISSEEIGNLEKLSETLSSEK